MMSKEEQKQEQKARKENGKLEVRDMGISRRLQATGYEVKTHA